MATNLYQPTHPPIYTNLSWSSLIQAYSVQPWPSKKYHLTHSTYLHQPWQIQTDPSLSRKATALQDVPTHPSIYLHQPQPIQTNPHLISTGQALQEVLSHL